MSIEIEMEDLEAQNTKAKNEQLKEAMCDSVKKPSKPITLKFEDIVYKIKDKEGAEKNILKRISGIVKTGEMLAILGPSGCGKSTLLMALGGRLSDGKLEGNITFNDKPLSNQMKKNIGFVTQDDVLHPHLTVTETLVFTALLRLPNTFTTQEKCANAIAMVSLLGLAKCKNSIIGGGLLRGVSGGERKRVSIGQEMLIDPSVLFLDEPTSGLDSTTAQRIVSSLGELAKRGKTIVMSIHQPSSRLFYMFRKVLLLSDGNPLYFGIGSNVMDYFERVGYAPVMLMNPSDFLLDIANGLSGDETQEAQAIVKQKLIIGYKENIDDNLKDELHENLHKFNENSDDNKQYSECGTSWIQQFSVLLQRSVKERKHEYFSGVKIIHVFVASILSGLLWWQTDISHLNDQLGLLFNWVGFWALFPSMQAIYTFPQERILLEKERLSGTYRLSSYFLSRIIGDLPMELALPTFYVTITYWMAGLRPTLINFLLTLIVMLLSVLVSQGLGLALGAMVMNPKSATTLGTIILLSSLLLGGFYVQHVPPFISWLKYLSIHYYTYKLLIRCQYDYFEKYPCEENSSGVCLVGDYPTIKAFGLNDQVMDVVAMLIMLVGYRLLAYIALMRVGVSKK